jgi:hypothetical protein
MNLLNFNKILHIILIILLSYFIYKQYYLNSQNNINNNRRVKFRDELGGNLTEIIKFEKIDF